MPEKLVEIIHFQKGRAIQVPSFFIYKQFTALQGGYETVLLKVAGMCGMVFANKVVAGVDLFCLIKPQTQKTI